MFGTVLALLVGIQSGITFGQAAASPSSCGSGQLALEGSTAFAPVAEQIATEYRGTCHAAAISVSAIATFNGLNAVNSSGDVRASASSSAGHSTSSPSSASSASSISAASAAASSPAAWSNTSAPASPPAATQMAMSDGPAPSGYSALVGHPIAVIIFAMVVNRQANVFNLTTAQARGIFSGSITNWQQVGGANMPVRIVSRHRRVGHAGGPLTPRCSAATSPPSRRTTA